MVLRRDFLAGAAAWGTLASIGTASAVVVIGSAREAVIADFLKQQPFHGVIAIAKAGKPMFSRAIGLADIEAKRATTLQTPYAIASISKWLTTLAVLKLCTAGTLDLDAPITRYLPAYRADTGAKITLRRLLSNTSGVPNGYLAAVKADATLVNSTLSAAEVVTRWGMGDFAFEPGSKFDYSLTNWIIVVAIVEAVTGKAFAEAMAEEVVTPLGLTHTTLSTPPDLAIAYCSVEPLQRHMENRPAFLAAGGGYYSTAEDLVAAAHKVFDGGFLAPARQSEMLRVQWAEQDYALGGRVKMRFVDGMPRVFAWETGRTAGYRSVLGHRFDDQTTIVLLNNTGLSQKVMDEFAIALFGVV
jgi:CubicO group peptidase (beta-lactamase class C family)